MSLPQTPIYPIPETTARVAQAIFPQGNIYMKLHERLGAVYEEQHCADLFSPTGQPAESPARLVLVIILQYVEGLTDRQAADAVRTRIDWKYLLGLELEDRGFHHSVLSELRTRLLTGNVEERLLDRLLEVCREQGWLKERGQQRTDSTHVLGAVRALNRLEGVGETLRHALNVLAVTVPDWLLAHSALDWVDRYGPRMDDYRLPKSQTERAAYAELIGQDGQHLLEAIECSPDHAWVRELPAIQTLIRVWQQNYHLQKDQLRWRASEELPKAAYFVSSPHDLDVRYSQKRGVSWIGYKVHLTETCDPELPHLITHVETTAAPVSDDAMTPRIHAALQTKSLLPAIHLVDTGYVKAEYLVSSQEGYGVDLVGPTRANYQWQARSATGFSASHFAIDWQTQQATCPAGQTSLSWTSSVDRHHNVRMVIKFSTTDCSPCPFHAQCTRGRRRSLSIQPEAYAQALQAARAREQPDAFVQQYAQRAGVEGTLSQGTRGHGLRRAHYLGLDKTHLQHVLTAVALNFVRIGYWLEDRPLAQTRPSAFVRLHRSTAP
jgi:transposase